MIPLPPELERVENDLKERRITGSEASSIVFSVRKKLGAPWNWKSWKIARKKILKSFLKKILMMTPLTGGKVYLNHL